MFFQPVRQRQTALLHGQALLQIRRRSGTQAHSGTSGSLVSLRGGIGAFPDTCNFAYCSLLRYSRVGNGLHLRKRWGSLSRNPAPFDRVTHLYSTCALRSASALCIRHCALYTLRLYLLFRPVAAFHTYRFADLPIYYRCHCVALDSGRGQAGSRHTYSARIIPAFSRPMPLIGSSKLWKFRVSVNRMRSRQASVKMVAVFSRSNRQ